LHKDAFSFNCTKVQKNHQNEKKNLNIQGGLLFLRIKELEDGKNKATG
jgi:hypothetical protein